MDRRGRTNTKEGKIILLIIEVDTILSLQGSSPCSDARQLSGGNTHRFLQSPKKYEISKYLQFQFHIYQIINFDRML